MQLTLADPPLVELTDAEILVVLNHVFETMHLHDLSKGGQCHVITALPITTPSNDVINSLNLYDSTCPEVNFAWAILKLYDEVESFVNENFTPGTQDHYDAMEQGYAEIHDFNIHVIQTFIMKFKS